MSRGEVEVSDHAVLRYLERGLGVEIERLRRRIARTVSPHMPADSVGPSGAAVVVDGLRYCVRARPEGGIAVTTVASVQAGPVSNRASRLRRRR